MIAINSFVELRKRRTELSLRQNINPAQYAEEWNRLAADFQAIGAVSNVEYCLSQWRHYRDEATSEAKTIEEEQAVYVVEMGVHA